MKVQMDRERTLILDLNAMVRFEDVTSKSLFKVKSIADLTSRDYRALVWACLVHEDPKLTVEQVGAMVSLKNMAEISETIIKAMVGEEEKDSPLPGTGLSASTTTA